MRNRNILVKTYLNDIEIESLDSKCIATNQTRSQLIRNLIQDYVVPAKPDHKFYSDLNKMNVINAKLSQIKSRLIGKEDVTKDIKMLIDENRKFIDDIRNKYAIPQKKMS